MRNGTIAFPSSSHLAIPRTPLIGDVGHAAVGDGQGAAVPAAAVAMVTVLVIRVPTSAQAGGTGLPLGSSCRRVNVGAPEPSVVTTMDPFLAFPAGA